ncbi:sugar-binding transcriptional regulator [Rossellomorea sp. BNER]|jgi:deoxyribonucleoside regulator|uniref:sugar-binding transcriptional regulator n=1 Tax=Rossellomorea sp. BNER TaxID=2962031 RepID=UPI003AF2AAEB|nr:sugar-binding transcriptional regulator [Rossellomorea sp. BNER]
MSDIEKDQLSIEVAKLYYLSNFGQQQIADKLKISRPAISRLLSYAKEKGYVQIEIRDPYTDMDQLAKDVKERYGLEDIIVTSSPSDDYETIKQSISKSAADYLQNNVKQGDILGVSWGTTIYETSKRMMKQAIKGVTVVQLKGGISHSKVMTHAYETIGLFADAFNTIPMHLPLPVVFDNAQVKKQVEEDRHIRRIIEMGRQANIAVFTVGTVRDEALLFKLGYFNSEEKDLLQKEAVGDICSRFFNENGEIVHEEINNRTIGIELQELEQKEKAILVAGGKPKLKAIKGALTGNHANVLITDQYTAERLLRDT